MSLSTRLVSTALLSLVSLAGCATDEPATTTDEHELYADGSQIWRQLAIPVCWENPTVNNAADRDLVEAAVNRTWAASTRVQFTGFGSCGLNSSGIRIRIADQVPAIAALGRGLDGDVNGMVLNFAFQNAERACSNQRQFCIESHAVRMFGHALGFALEHARPDTQCHLPDRGFLVPEEEGDTTIGPFDASSVMNDCAPMTSSLSPGDIKGARQYYGSSTFTSRRKAALVWPSTIGNSKIYFFNGSEYTRYNLITSRTDSGYPLGISSQWGNWPAAWVSGGIDAAMSWTATMAYMFRGDELVAYDIANDEVIGTPQAISGRFGNWPVAFDRVDAAIKWTNGKSYFFRGGEYIRLDNATQRIDQLARPILGNWPGLFTADIDYAFVHPSNGKAYFFKGTQYQRYDIANDGVEATLPIVGNWSGVPF